MSQGTFWDGDEQEKVEVELPASFLPAHKQEDAEPLPPKRDFRINKANAQASPYQGEKKAEALKTPEDMTAEHLAVQLMKLWKQGIITGPNDPDIEFHCRLIIDTGGTVKERIADSS